MCNDNNNNIIKYKNNNIMQIFSINSAEFMSAKTRSHDNLLFAYDLYLKKHDAKMLETVRKHLAINSGFVCFISSFFSKEK